MHAKIKGTALISHNAQLRALLFACILATTLFAPFFHSGSQAQEAQTNPQQSSRPKPQLVEITFNEDDNAEALKIAKTLNPDFFNVDTENFSQPASFFAKFVSLDEQKPRRFMVLTVTNTPYYCTTYGCPYYIYENKGDNKWSLVLSLQTHTIYYDANTQDGKPRNLISLDYMQAQKLTRIWMWNGLRYEEISKKK